MAFWSRSSCSCRGSFLLRLSSTSSPRSTSTGRSRRSSQPRSRSPRWSGARCSPATVIVPVQAGAWILLLSANRIAIADPLLILLHVTLGTLLLILLGAFCALYYRERTAAQFVFSTALVVLLLLVLALPYNPLNLVARISVGTAGAMQWVVLAVTCLAVLALGYGMQKYAGRIGRAQSGK